MRSRLRAKHRSTGPCRRGTVELLRVWRPQHGARPPAVPGLSGLAETSAVARARGAQRNVGWLEGVRQVVAAVRASDVTELELASGEFSVRVRRDPEGARKAAVSGPVGAIETPEDPDARLHRVVAPFTGVFYRSPTPSARPYVNEGDWVEADVGIGLVETMKIFNEVTADCSGRIVRFSAEKSQLEHAGDALVLIEPGERAPAESEPH